MKEKGLCTLVWLRSKKFSNTSLSKHSCQKYWYDSTVYYWQGIACFQRENFEAKRNRESSWGCWCSAHVNYTITAENKVSKENRGTVSKIQFKDANLDNIELLEVETFKVLFFEIQQDEWQLGFLLLYTFCSHLLSNKMQTTVKMRRMWFDSIWHNVCAGIYGDRRCLWD